MAGKYYFLCEFFHKQMFVYAIKSSSTNYHYFEEEDSVIKAHTWLPVELGNQIVLSKKPQEISVDLNHDQIANYVTDGKFVFKGKELKTYIELAGIQTDQPNSSRKKVSKSTDDLVFLKEFEKCEDTKTEKDKLFKIRNFVNHEDKQVFSKLFFTSDWSTARSTFLKKYSLAFTTNKKRDLDIPFDSETSLRSFVLRKMKALSTYTRLSVENQLEIILNELPVQVSNLFIVHDKVNCTKIDILEFCDTIQEIVEDTYDEPDKNVTLTANPIERNQVVQDLEVFNYDCETVSEIDSSEVETSDLEKTTDGQKSLTKKSAKRSRGELLVGRPSKIKKIICKTSENDDDYQSASSSCSNF